VIRPLGDGVIVEPVDVTEKVGGVFLPQTALKRSNEGTVVALGPGLYDNGKRVPIDLVIGDRVLYLRMAGYKIEVNGKNLIACSERDILCAAEKDDVLGFEATHAS
jgi:chaperonin GroES